LLLLSLLGESVLSLSAENSHANLFLYFYLKGADPNMKIVEPHLHKIPNFLFTIGCETILPECRSPVNLLNLLYRNDINGQRSSIISRLILSFIEPLDFHILLYFLVYRKSLDLARSSNTLEEIDTTNRIEQFDRLLFEVFNCESLDVSDNMLQILLPTIELKAFHQYNYEIESLSWLDPMILIKTRKYENLINDYRILHAAHTIINECGVLNYCIKNRIKSVFRYPQISSVVSRVFNSTMAPQSKERIETGQCHNIIYFKNKDDSYIYRFFNNFLAELICGCPRSNNSLIKKLHYLQNLRYCPKNMIVLESMSKILTLILVTLATVYRY
jgi:hypothetical protein